MGKTGFALSLMPATYWQRTKKGWQYNCYICVDGYLEYYIDGVLQ